MRVLGIDPGIQRTGYGIIDDNAVSLKAVDWGVIKTSSRKPFAQRLSAIYHELTKVVAEHHPEVAAVEDVFLANNARSALKLGQARGAAIIAASNMGLPVEEYSALQIKQSVAGYGRAEKDQVSKMVCALLGLSSELGGGDAADALAAAICHVHSVAFINIQRIDRDQVHGHSK